MIVLHFYVDAKIKLQFDGKISKKKKKFTFLIYYWINKKWYKKIILVDKNMYALAMLVNFSHMMCMAMKY